MSDQEIPAAEPLYDEEEGSSSQVQHEMPVEQVPTLINPSVVDVSHPDSKFVDFISNISNVAQSDDFKTQLCDMAGQIAGTSVDPGALDLGNMFSSMMSILGKPEVLNAIGPLTAAVTASINSSGETGEAESVLNSKVSSYLSITNAFIAEMKQRSEEELRSFITALGHESLQAACVSNTLVNILGDKLGHPPTRLYPSQEPVPEVD